MAHRSRESFKCENFKTLCIKYEVDIACLTEINKDWRLVKQENTIWNTILTWIRYRRVQVSHNMSK